MNGVECYQKFLNNSFILEKESFTDINKLTPKNIKYISNEICSILKEIHLQKKIPQEKMDFFNEFHFNYIASYKKSIPKAEAIHQKFLKIFKDSPSPTLNLKKNIVTVSYDQFIFGSFLIKKYFPGLYFLGNDDYDFRHKLMSHILKIIFIGNEEKYSKKLKPFTFSIFELDKLTSKNLVQLKTIEKDYVEEVLIQLIQTYTIDLNSQLCDFVGIILKHFINTVINNNMITFYFENGKKFWPKDNGNTFDSFLKSFVNVYLEFEEKNLNIKSSTQNFCQKLLKKFSCRTLNYSNENFFSDLFSKIPENIKEKFLSLTIIENNENLQNFIRLKIFEFALFTANFNAHNILKGLGNEYKKCESHKKFNSLEISLVKNKYILNDKLRIVHHIIKNKINVVSNKSKDLISQKDLKIRSQSFCLSFRLNFEKKTSNEFYINHLGFPGSVSITNCLFDWNTAKFVTEGALGLGLINLEAFSETQSFQFKKFICNLEVLAKLLPGELLKINEDLRFEKIPQSWHACITYFVSYLSDVDIESYHELIRNLFEFYEKGNLLCKSYVKKIKFARSEENNLIYKLRIAIDQSKKGLENLSKTIENNGLPAVSNLFENIFNHIEMDWFQEIPLINPFLYEYTKDERGILEYFTSGLFQSKNPDDIDWKIYRYQAVLKQLRSALEDFLAKHFSQYEKAQLLENVYQTKLEIETQKLILNLLDLDLTEKKGDDLNQRYLSQIRDAYAINFIMPLRVILCELEKNEEEKQQEQLHKKIQSFFYDLCEFFFTKIDLKEISLELNEKFNLLGKNNQDSLEDIYQKDDGSLTYRVFKMHNHFYNARQSAKVPFINGLVKSALDHWNVGFDPTTQSNNPQRLGKITLTINGKNHSIKLLAFGSPTIEGYIGKESIAKISMEFLTCMKSYKRHGKRHLFVINQDFTSGRSFFGRVLRGGDETDRINAILKCSTDPQIKDTFYCMVLSRNSMFYAQEGYYEFQSNADLYKKNLLEQHFDIDRTLSGNYIPIEVLEKIPELKKFCQKAIDSIHFRLFNNNKELNVYERQVFYDFFQDNLILKVAMEIYVNSLNMGCKDAIDRAAEAVARLSAYLGIVNISEEFKDLYKELRKQYEVLLMSRALLVRKRAIISARIQRNISTVSFYENHKFELKQCYSDLFSDNIFKLVL